jgi:hypothetical protein
VRPHDGKIRYGGTQVTTRQATGPLQPIWVLHWPYRKTFWQTRRWSQLPVAACGRQFQQLSEQNGPHPLEQLLQSAWQSM